MRGISVYSKSLESLNILSLLLLFCCCCSEGPPKSAVTMVPKVSPRRKTGRAAKVPPPGPAYGPKETVAPPIKTEKEDTPPPSPALKDKVKPAKVVAPGESWSNTVELD